MFDLFQGSTGYKNSILVTKSSLRRTSSKGKSFKLQERQIQACRGNQLGEREIGSLPAYTNKLYQRLFITIN